MDRLCFRYQHQDEIDDQMYTIPFGNARKFVYKSLQMATNNFSKDTLIGKGGYGKVYRGTLPNGTLIAVKKYYHANQLDNMLKEFSRLVEVMSCIQHPNINQVLGYCIQKNHKLLVTEYVDNGSLFELLLNQDKRESVFNWPMRVAVCIGIARAISHLHEDANPRVIHRDITASNILIDNNFTPKITDFDLVKFIPESDLPIESGSDRVGSVSGPTTCIRGTFGYLDPEYLKSSKCTPKSDVYGFGVVMLEIISGRKAVDVSYYRGEMFVVEWASNLYRNDRVLKIIDPALGDFPTDQVQRFVDVSFSCTRAESKGRPSMREVVQMLNGVCNSWRKPLDMPTTYGDTPYLSAASSFRSSVAPTYDEGEGESSIVEGEASVTPTHTELQAQEEQQHMGIIVSGSGELLERLSQTMVFNKCTTTKLDFPEAVYPPFRTRVFRRGGSRNLYTF